MDCPVSDSVKIPFICILFRELLSVNQIVTVDILLDKMFGIKVASNDESTVPAILLCEMFSIQELLPY